MGRATRAERKPVGGVQGRPAATAQSILVVQFTGPGHVICDSCHARV